MSILNMNGLTDDERKSYKYISSTPIITPLKNLIDSEILNSALRKNPSHYSIAKKYLITLVNDFLVYNPEIEAERYIEYRNNTIYILIKHCFPMVNNYNNYFSEYSFNVDNPFSLEYYSSQLDRAIFIDGNHAYSGRPLFHPSLSLDERYSFLESLSILDNVLEQDGDLLNIYSNLHLCFLNGCKFKYLFFDCFAGLESEKFYFLELKSKIIDIKITKKEIYFNTGRNDVFISLLDIEQYEINFVVECFRQLLFLQRKYEFSPSMSTNEILTIMCMDLI